MWASMDAEGRIIPKPKPNSMFRAVLPVQPGCPSSARKGFDKWFHRRPACFDHSPHVCVCACMCACVHLVCCDS